MSIYRFMFRGFPEGILASQTVSGGTIVNAFSNFIDVDLNDNSDLLDLIELLNTLGFDYTGLSDPVFPPNDWREVFSFAETALVLDPAADNSFGFSTGEVGESLGIAADFLPTRAGRVVGVVLRSSENVTVEAFVSIDASRTAVSSPTALVATVVTPLVITQMPPFVAGDVVRVGIANTGVGQVTANLTVGLEIEWG